MTILENKNHVKEGIYISGSWGAGKTLFLDGLKQIYEYKTNKRILVIDAWKLSHLETIESMTTYSILSNEEFKNKLLSGKSSHKKKKIIRQIDKSLRSLDNNKSAGVIFSTIDFLVDFFKKESPVFGKDQSEKSNKINIFYNYIKEFFEIDYIIFDELDRCIPTIAINIIRQIKFQNKTNFDINSTLFISSGNLDELIMVIKHIYGENYSAGAYFEKIYLHDIIIKCEKKDKIEYLEQSFREFGMIVPDFFQQGKESLFNLSTFRTLKNLTSNIDGQLFYKWFAMNKMFLNDSNINEYSFDRMMTYSFLIEISMLKDIDHFSFVAMTIEPTRINFNKIVYKYFNYYVHMFVDNLSQASTPSVSNELKYREDKFYEQYLKLVHSIEAGNQVYTEILFTHCF